MKVRGREGTGSTPQGSVSAEELVTAACAHTPTLPHSYTSIRSLAGTAADLAASALHAAHGIPSGGVLYYALGGGLGHLTRGLAIARHFRRLCPEPYVILTNCCLPAANLAAMRNASGPCGEWENGRMGVSRPTRQEWEMAERAVSHTPTLPHSHTPTLPRLDSPILPLSHSPHLPPSLLLLGDEPGPAALAELVRALVAALRPAVLAVDAFPAGILGELPAVLPQFPCRRVAVLRRLQPRWVERWGLPALLPAAYDAAALVEQGAAFAGFPRAIRHVETAPVLVRDAGELLPPAAARERLGYTGDGPLVLAIATGARPEDGSLLGVVARAAATASAGAAVVRLATPQTTGVPDEARVSHFPLVEWLPGADLVIGACGYNLCHETAAAGTPAVFVPQRRLYDDQFGRAAGRRVASLPAELEQRIREALGARQAGRARPSYENGAAAVAQLLAELARPPSKETSMG